MHKLILVALIATLLFAACKKSSDREVNHINCDGLVTDTTGTGDTAVVYFPNAFTPNNDGINDVSRVIVKGIESISFKIYDASNNMIFIVTDLSVLNTHSFTFTSPWEPSGYALTYETYYYKIQATTLSNHHIGMCGELYKLACFPPSILRTSVHFEDQLRPDGTFSSTTAEHLPDCP